MHVFVGETQGRTHAGPDACRKLCMARGCRGRSRASRTTSARAWQWWQGPAGQATGWRQVGGVVFGGWAVRVHRPGHQARWRQASETSPTGDQGLSNSQPCRPRSPGQPLPQSASGSRESRQCSCGVVCGGPSAICRPMWAFGDLEALGGSSDETLWRHQRVRCGRAEAGPVLH